MRRIFFTHRKITAIIFSLVITKKPSKIVKFTKIHQTLRNTYLTWPKRNQVKLVVPPYLLKQENVCLIPREAEQPSRRLIWKIWKSVKFQYSENGIQACTNLFDSVVRLTRTMDSFWLHWWRLMSGTPITLVINYMGSNYVTVSCLM